MFIQIRSHTNSRIYFKLDKKAQVEISAYNIAGAKVSTILNNVMPKGRKCCKSKSQSIQLACIS